jgi:hypothetical protein
VKVFSILFSISFDVSILAVGADILANTAVTQKLVASDFHYLQKVSRATANVARVLLAFARG